VSRLNHDELPIVPHSDSGDKNCCGCLIVVELENGNANLVCNECGALILTVPNDEAPQILMRMAIEQGMCGATCPHCGALNPFPGFDSIEAFICRECGQGVSVKLSLQ
jgi:predicted RNA-binding Zn-ribbon protein involved in translation (DUF1610 family)